VSSEDKKKARKDLDRSIDVGMDQFGRFVKLRLIWIVLSLVVLWYAINTIITQDQVGISLFSGILQISFAIFYIVIQFAALFWFLGRPRLYWVMPGETGVTFDDYKGNPEVLESARRIVRLLQGTQEFKDMGGQPVRGLLLTGPPGTGKSYLAQCMSTEAGVPFAYASAASFRAMFIGMDVLMISRLYRKARRLAREYGACVVFMDEIDAIGMSRSARGGGTMAMGGGLFGGMGGTGGLNQLLMEMDPPNIETGWFKKILRILGLAHGRVQSQPVLTVGATNVPDTLDPALLRPGRFDRQINVAPPTDRYRGEVIEYYLEKVKHDSNISMTALVQRLVDYTPVAIKHVVNEAVIIAHFDGRDQITYKDLTEAQDVHEFGLRQLSELTPVDRRRLAYHEAGHAVACYYLMDRYFPAYVTLHRRSDLEGAEAFALPRPKETVKTQSKEDILARIQVSLAARASEELFLDLNMSGVTSDFSNATQLATLYVGAFGMDGTITSYLAFASALGSSPMGLPKLPDRVESILQSQMKAVKRLLQEHSEALIAIAEALIERDELVAEDIEQLIKEADARRVSKVVISEFEPMLGNGHSNGKNGGYALAAGRTNGSTGSGNTTDAPHTDSQPLPFSGDQTDNMQLPPTNSGPSFFVGG
jgi:cell division protease FtsH